MFARIALTCRNNLIKQRISCCSGPQKTIQRTFLSKVEKPVCAFNISDKKYPNGFQQIRSLETKKSKISKKEQFKRAFAEYGATLVIFHVGISLISLGCCYLIISSGVDMEGLLTRFGVNNVVSNTGTFVAAYALHKVFAPVRITITLTSVPFIVRYLRRVNILKIKN